MATSSSWLSITGKPLDLDAIDNMLGSCKPLSSYEQLNNLGEGTYGIVSRAKDLQTSQIVALKQIRVEASERHNGIPITALREISILRSLKHPNIINVLDIAVDDQQPKNRDIEDRDYEEVSDNVYMVMEYAQQVGAPFLRFRARVWFGLGPKCIFRQVLEGLEYLHDRDVIHRDIKMSNILMTSQGIVKIADFGMAREYSERPLTPGVVTVWYRSPELLLGTSRYTLSVDIWSAGLILGELLLCTPVLQGENEIEQLSWIVKLLGTPTPEDMSSLADMGCPDLSSWRRERLSQGRVDNLERRFKDVSTPETIKYLSRFLTWDPRRRWTASEALGYGRSRWAADAERWWLESPKECKPALLPTYPEVRNGEKSGAELAMRGIKAGEGKGDGLVDQASSDGSKAKDDRGYVFDFGEESSSKRPVKRQRPV